MRFFTLFAALFGLFLAACSPTGRSTAGPQSVAFPHIHGLGFSADGTSLSVPAHDGLLVFANGSWQVPDVPANDYMGYTTTDNGFYSSGHPGSGSNLPNPLGLVKSDDGGQTLEILAFESESDFHLLGVGYENHAIYVVNSAPNSKLMQGLFYSLDEGQTWNQSQVQGLNKAPIQIAVHPTNESAIAIATESGLYLSSDHGNTFALIGEAVPVSAITFHPKGQYLLFGYHSLTMYDLTESMTETITTPTIAEADAISYIAINPASDEIAFATFNKDIYLSQANRQSWQKIAVQGAG